MITDDYRQRLAALPPINPADLRLTLGPVPGHDPLDPACSRCGSWSGEEETAFGLALTGKPGKVCPACLASAGEGTYVAALGLLAQGLEGVCTALGSVPPELQDDLLKAAREALSWLGD